LVEAAQTLFAQQGVDATRINEITEAADVGFGSFYNHFESKEAIVTAVVESAAVAAGAAIDAVTADLDDPAEVVAVAHRALISLASQQPEFGWLFVRLEISHDLATTVLGPYARRDLERGVAAGRFVVESEPTALLVISGALLAVVRAVLRGEAPDGVAEHHAAAVLRVFGVPAAEAGRVAQRPMPAIDLTP
jgi:AcrR family transcriptional regulator